ncbi:MAG: hypothetical protein MSS69_07650 [Spirochaetales bacterium]|nr:hypothetical protein [Spirochaetales bacterium]
MKKAVTLLLLVLLSVSFAFASVYISVNDLDAEKVTETKDYDGVFLIATPDKHMTIEMLDDGREAEDGEVFNGRIKLEGSGKINQRAISFDAKKGEVLKVYLNSSSKTEARTLVLADASGNQIGALTAPVDGSSVGIETFEIPQDGTYYLWSKKSGINIYMLIVE